MPAELVAVRGVVGAHRRRVARRDPLPQPGAMRAGGQHLDEARLLVVDLVAVGVDAQAVPLGQRRRRRSTERTPSSRVSSKCGIAPMTSTPRRAASSISSSPPGKEQMPSCGNATSCSPITSRTRSRTSSSASRATRHGSVTSTWLRTCSVPLAAYQRSTSSARSTTSSRVSIGLRSPQQAMPSQSVPLSFQRGSPGGERGVEVHVRLDERRADQRPRRVDDLAGLDRHRPAAREGEEPPLVDVDVD